MSLVPFDNWDRSQSSCGIGKSTTDLATVLLGKGLIIREALSKAAGCVQKAEISKSVSAINSSGYENNTLLPFLWGLNKHNAYRESLFTVKTFPMDPKREKKGQFKGMKRLIPLVSK